MRQERLKRTLAMARRAVTLATGYALVLVGGVLFFLPGPGLPLVLAGLALLGRELPWARRLQLRVQHAARSVAGRVSRYRARTRAGSAPLSPGPAK